MIKLEALEYFTIKRFDELENIVRKNKDKDIKGALFLGDTFECNKDLADYITNEIPNPVNRPLAKVIKEKNVEVKPIHVIPVEKAGMELKDGKVLPKKPVERKKRKTIKK